MKSEILNELSTLTTVKKEDIEKVFSLTISCICDCVLESVLSDEQISEIDIGIGTLSILHTSSEIKYRFSPSAKLKEEIKNVVLNKESTLDKTVEDTLKERLLYIYKDLF